MTEKSRRIIFDRRLELTLKKLQELGGPIYTQLSVAKLKHLRDLGFLERPDPKGPYHLTPKVAETLDYFKKEPPSPRVSRTKRLENHLKQLEHRVSSADIAHHLEQDAARGGGEPKITPVVKKVNRFSK